MLFFIIYHVMRKSRCKNISKLYYDTIFYILLNICICSGKNEKEKEGEREREREREKITIC